MQSDIITHIRAAVGFFLTHSKKPSKYINNKQLHCTIAFNISKLIT